MPLQPTESRRRSQAHGGFFVNPQIHESTVLATFLQEKVPIIRGKSREKATNSREKIIALLSEDGTLTMAALARRTGITPKAVEKQIARLKADGILERIGPDKGGRWRIRQRGSLGGKVQ